MRPQVDAWCESTTSGEEMTMLHSSTSRITKEHSSTVKRKNVVPNASNVCIARRLRAKRTSRGISEKEISEKLGIDRDDLMAYEHGETRVSARLLLRIAKLLDVRPDYFFQGYTAEELSACLASRSLIRTA
jgi:ribosome-binding protein aMBF1 (putative translation factor)